MFSSGILLAAQANAGDSRRDQDTSDLDLECYQMPDEGTDQNTTQPPYRLTTCFSVMSSLTPEQGIRDASKQNRNFRPKGEGRSGRRPLLPKRKLNILVDLTLGKSNHSVVTLLHA